MIEGRNEALALCEGLVLLFRAPASSLKWANCLVWVCAFLTVKPILPVGLIVEKIPIFPKNPQKGLNEYKV